MPKQNKGFDVDVPGFSVYISDTGYVCVSQNEDNLVVLHPGQVGILIELLEEAREIVEPIGPKPSLEDQEDQELSNLVAEAEKLLGRKINV